MSCRWKGEELRSGCINGWKPRLGTCSGIIIEMGFWEGSGWAGEFLLRNKIHTYGTLQPSSNFYFLYINVLNFSIS